MVTIKNVGREVLYNWTQELVAPKSLVIAVSNQTMGAYREKSSDGQLSVFNNSPGHAKENPLRPGTRSRPLRIPYQVVDYKLMPWDENIVARAYVQDRIEDQVQLSVRDLLPTSSAPSRSALVLPGPDDLEALEALDDDEQAQVRALLKEILDHFRGGAARPYEFSPFSVGAGEFGPRVKNEAIKVARAKRWEASDLDATGGFFVRRPKPSSEGSNAPRSAVVADVLAAKKVDAVERLSKAANLVTTTLLNTMGRGTTGRMRGLCSEIIAYTHLIQDTRDYYSTTFHDALIAFYSCAQGAWTELAGLRDEDFPRIPVIHGQVETGRHRLSDAIRTELYGEGG